MALIKCPECNRDVSESAMTCPNCGYDIKSFVQKKKMEDRQKAIEEDNAKRAKERAEKIHNTKELLFGSVLKKIVWIICALLCLSLIVGLSIYNSDLSTCKSKVEEAYEYYGEVHGNLMTYKTIGDYIIYDVDENTMWLYNNAYNEFIGVFEKLSPQKQNKFITWFNNNYMLSFDSFKTNCEEDHLGQSLSFDWAEYLSTYRTTVLKEQREAKAKEVEIINKELSADGNYYDFTATLKNNTNKTISYLKYTVFLFDQNGNNIDSDWSNWSGTFKPGATINVETMINKYSSEKVKFKVVIDEYE